jgi:tight adherence protein C
MIALVLVGAAIGAVLFSLCWRLLPRRVSPLVALGRFDAQHNSGLGDPAGFPSHERETLTARLGTAVAVHLQRRGIAYTSLRQDLALTGRTYEVAMGRKVLSFVAGFLLVLTTAVGLQSVAEFNLPAGSPLVLALAVAVAFFFLPDLEARKEATQRRRDFRRAFGAFLDLVALEMAGSAAPAEALPAAARVGSGWPLELLRDTLYRATAAGVDHWEALSELGERIGVPELRELGALVKLVGRDGAQVRDTLRARAASMRRRELADAEGEAGERDQSMRMAQLLIGAGFIAFLMYPAMVAVLAL